MVKIHHQTGDPALGNHELHELHLIHRAEATGFVQRRVVQDSARNWLFGLQMPIDGHKHGTTHSYVYCTVKKLGDLRNEVTVLLINIQMHEMLQSGACPMDP